LQRSSKSPMAKRKVQLEPKEIFKTAIVGKTDDGHLLYSYYRLIYCVIEINDFSPFDAKEWVDYNIMPMCEERWFGVTFNKRYARKGLNFFEE